MSVDLLKDLDIEIEVVEAKINEMKLELKELKQHRDLIKKPIELVMKIKKYEKMYPDSIERNLNSLVKIDEPFDEWYERFGRHTIGGKKDKYWARDQYLKGGYIGNNYIKWLVELGDPRVLDTVIYYEKVL